MASDGQSASIGADSKETEGDHLQRGRRASGPAQIAAFRAGLAVCLAGVAVAAPLAVWRLSAPLENAGNNRNAAVAPMRATIFRLSNTIAAPFSTVALFRRRDAQYRKVELRLLQGRYAELERLGRRSKWRRRHRPLQYLLVQLQYLAEPLSANGTGEGIDLSGLLSDDDITAATTDETSGIFPDSATSSDTMQDGNATIDNDSSPAQAGTDTLTLSGGSISDTCRVTVDAGGTLQLFSTPNWSFDAKFDGEFAPETTKADAGGMLQLLAEPHWSFTAKFDGEFAPQPQLIAGSGVLDYTW